MSRALHGSQHHPKEATRRNRTQKKGSRWGLWMGGALEPNSTGALTTREASGIPRNGMIADTGPAPRGCFVN